MTTPTRPGADPIPTASAAAGARFRVDPGELAATADRATHLGAALLDAAHTALGLGDVGPHAGWAIAGALGRCASGWHRELTDTSGAVSEVGARLRNTVAAYRGTESATAAAFRALGSDGPR